MPYSMCSSGKFHLNSFKNNDRPVCIDAVVPKGAFSLCLSLHVGEVARHSGICELEDSGRLQRSSPWSLPWRFEDCSQFCPGPALGGSLRLSSPPTQAAGAQPASQLFGNQRLPQLLTTTPLSSLSEPCPSQQALFSGGSCKQPLSSRTAVSKAR